jgi:hypothetical protein
MLAVWILGSSFLIFILSAIVYVLSINVSQPETNREGQAETVGPLVETPVGVGGKYLISKCYQVVFSPRAFVDYPFGIRVVFTKPDPSMPVVQKLPERTEHRRSNVNRYVRDSEYSGWPQSALQDPELMVTGGFIEFESEEAEPGIRVEVTPPAESFRAIQAAAEHVLKRGEETVFLLWLHPLEPKTISLAIVVSLIKGTGEPATPGTAGKNGHELATITLTLPVTVFPIALR